MNLIFWIPATFLLGLVGMVLCEALRRHSRLAPKACRSEPRFFRVQLLAPAKRTEALFHCSRQTERTSRTPSRDAWREESGTG